MQRKPIWWPNRHSVRLRGHNYTGLAAYFVTICACRKKCLFGEVVEQEMKLSNLGSLVQTEWKKTPQVRPCIQLDSYVVMPNHLHGILVFTGEDPRSTGIGLRQIKDRRVCLPGSLGAVICQFKSMVTKRSLKIGMHGPIWQRGYYERIIEDQESTNRIREYIETNPLRWHFDCENPARKGDDPFDRWLKQVRKPRR